MTKSINQTLLNCRWCSGFEAGTDKSGNERFPKSNLTLFGGWVPWPSVYGRRLVFKRSWVQIPAPDTGWTFFTYICCKNCTVCLKRSKMNKQRPGLAHFKKILYVGKRLIRTISKRYSIVSI